MSQRLANDVAPLNACGSDTVAKNSDVSPFLGAFMNGFISRQTSSVTPRADHRGGDNAGVQTGRNHPRAVEPYRQLRGTECAELGWP